MTRRKKSASALMHIFAAICVEVLIPSSAGAQEVCAPILTLPSLVQAPAYDPFSSSATVEDIEIGYQDGACLAAVVLKATIGWGGLQPRLSQNGHELGFNLWFAGRDFTAGQSAVGEADSLSNSISITLPSNQSGLIAERSRLIIPEGQIVPPGFYQLDIPGDLVRASGLLSQVEGSAEIRATPISIITEVLAVMRLGVTGCDLSGDRARLEESGLSSLDFASNCQLNLGDPSQGMSSGDARRARINAQANVNFKIAMTSRNGGVLKLAEDTRDDRETERIAYSATLEGQGQGAAFDCRALNCGTSDPISPSSSPLGTDLYFQVKITDPDMTQKRAGRYSDTITLIIQPAS